MDSMGTISSPRRMCVLSLLLFGGIALNFATSPSPSLWADETIHYEQSVAPILRQHCYECHDGGKKQAELRLDVRSAALRGGESGHPAIVPGDLEKSGLWQRVTSASEDERMPPTGAPLAAGEIEILRQWIVNGAVWPDALSGEEADPRQHWAYQPPSRPPIPTVAHPEWIRNPVDAFVLDRLQQRHLLPAVEADRVTLIRRLSLDLIGLPPSVEEVDAFVLDQRPDAYEQLVNRLLKSPHYGERWGRLWLDAARYADSDGYEKDKVRQVWMYRDWVVNALNRDLPYNQFIIEQLAGDLLPHATQDQRVATGFLRNSMINEEGGIDPEQFRMTAMFDRMDALGKSVLGLTIQCAQCHNHKYDPLTMQDYYGIFAFLNNDHESNIVVYTPTETQRRAELLQQIEVMEADLRHRFPDWQQRMAAWEESLQAGRVHWQVITPAVEEDSTGGQKYLPQADGSFLCLGYAPTYHSVRLDTQTDVRGITGFRLELLTDPNLPCRGPGRSLWGTAALTEFKVEAAPADGSSAATSVAWEEATADFNPPETPLAPIFDDLSGKRRVTGPISMAIDDVHETAWGTDAGPGRRNQPRVAVFRAKQPIDFAGGTKLTIRLAQEHGGWNSDDNQSHNVGRFRLSVTTDAAPRALAVPAGLLPILEIPAAARTEQQQRQLFSYWRTTVAEWQAENDQIERLWQQHPEGSTQLVLTSRDTPRQTHMLHRGDFLQPREPIPPTVPAFFHAFDPQRGTDRLAFATWLTDARSPTVARAMVNRVWQAYFGVGIVETPEDLGMRGAAPSHPELLNWLVVEFMERGWSLKELHRLIVMSSTYRQSSVVAEQTRRDDPQNRWLARGSRFRLDAELVRDAALAASGLLNPELGGASVHPPLPEFLMKPPVSYGPKPWPEDKGPNRYRRGIYTFRFRSVPYPALEVFDAPNGDFACVRRSRSNTPLQALTTLNEPLFLECADALALRMERDGGSTIDDQLTYGFRRCVSRYPQAGELAELRTLWESQRQAAAIPSVTATAAAGETAPSAAAPTPSAEAITPERRALIAVARVLLNLDETLTRE